MRFGTVGKVIAATLVGNISLLAPFAVLAQTSGFLPPAGSTVAPVVVVDGPTPVFGQTTLDCSNSTSPGCVSGGGLPSWFSNLFSPKATTPSTVFTQPLDQTINPSAYMDKATKDYGLGTQPTTSAPPIGQTTPVTAPSTGSLPDLPSGYSYATQGVVTNAAADLMCTPYNQQCPCGFMPPIVNGVCTTRSHNTANCAPGICQVIESGSTITGVCVGPKRCRAVVAPGIGGSGNVLGSLGSSIASNLGPIMLGVGLLTTLLKSSGGSGSGNGSAGGYSSGGSIGGSGTICTTYTPVNDPKLVTSSSCTYYVPGSGTGTSTGTGTGTGGTCSSLDHLLGTCGTGTSTLATSTVDGSLAVAPLSGSAPLTITATFNDLSPSCPHTAVALNYGDGSSAIVALDGKTSCGADAQNVNHTFTTPGTYQVALLRGDGSILRSTSVAVMQPSNAQTTTDTVSTQLTTTQTPTNTTTDLVGNIVFGTGATFVASKQDNNQAVAGFIGTNGTPAASQGLAAQLCVSRPWNAGFLAAIIPASFFDNLCVSHGYQVGAAAPAITKATVPQVQLTQSAPAKKPTPATSAPATPVVAPKVTIWATPASVSLGSRTTILWNVDNPGAIQSCTVTSPDGSFVHNMSGSDFAAVKSKHGIPNASTVPILGETTFTISCLTIDGQHVSNFVTVSIAL